MKTRLFEPLLNLWNTLQPRERLVVAGGGVILLALLCYAVVWAPLQHELSRLRADVPKQRAQLALMQAQARQVARLRASTRSSVGAGNLLTGLEQSAQQLGVRENITRMEPDGTNTVRLSLDSVNFNTLLSWLADLQSKGGIRTETATITAQPDPGLVDARLLVRGSGS